MCRCRQKIKKQTKCWKGEQQEKQELEIKPEPAITNMKGWKYSGSDVESIERKAEFMFQINFASEHV